VTELSADPTLSSFVDESSTEVEDIDLDKVYDVLKRFIKAIK
jgi:hypothetical protein